MGGSGTVVLRTLRELVPCEGEEGTRAEGVGARCGRRGGYCPACEVVLKALGKAWHMKMMADIIAQVGVLAMRAWVTREVEVEFWEYRSRNHQCEGVCRGYDA